MEVVSYNVRFECRTLTAVAYVINGEDEGLLLNFLIVYKEIEIAKEIEKRVYKHMVWPFANISDPTIMKF